MDHGKPPIVESGNQVNGDWRKVYSGASTWLDNFAAGTALIDIRVQDAVGLQVRQITEHTLQATVNQGVQGWVWTAAGQRYARVLTSPVWIAVNMLLRALGLRSADAATPRKRRIPGRKCESYSPACSRGCGRCPRPGRAGG